MLMKNPGYISEIVLSQARIPLMATELEKKDAVLRQRRLLEIASRMRRSTEEFRCQLPVLLKELGADVPARILQPAPGKPGRPPSTNTEKILSEWIKRGRPQVTGRLCDQIGKTTFAAEIKKASPGSAEFRRVRERVRRTLSRSNHLAT
jgi:hypothetical protein